jgi:hypothetical protein
MDGRSTEQLYSANALAKLAGVGPTTIHNWTTRPARPLATVSAPSGRIMYRLSDLRQFVIENPDLRGAAAAGLRLQAADRNAGAPSGLPTESHVPDEEAEALRAALRDLKTAVDASTRAVARSAELARQTAAAHSEIIAELQVTLRAYDSALTIATASATRHD